MADSSVPITPGVGANIDTRTTTNGDHRQVVAVGDPSSDNVAKVNMFGDLMVSITNPTTGGYAVPIVNGGLLINTNDMGPLAQDMFEGSSLDTNIWTPSGTVAPSQSGGGITLAPGTANSASSVISQNLTGAVGVTSGQEFVNFVVTLEAAQPTNPNVHRFWGKGVAASYAYATPLTDAIGFEIDGTGALNVVYYVGGTRYVINSTNPALIASNAIGVPGAGTALPTGTNANNLGMPLSWHPNTDRFFFNLRPDFCVFGIGDVSGTPCGIVNFLAPNQQSLPLRMAAITAPASATIQSVSIRATMVQDADTWTTGKQISDATYPNRRVNVGKSGGLSVKGAAVTGTSATIAGASTGTVGPLDVSEAGNVSFVVKNNSAALPWTGTPVIAFEQSDDGTSWSPLPVVRDDNQYVNTTHTLPANTANTEFVFNGGLYGVSWVRARVTSGTTANALIINIKPGGILNSPLSAVILPGDLRQLGSALIPTSGNSVTLANLNGQAQASIQLSGTWSGTLQFEGSLEGTTFTALNATMVGTTNAGTTTTNLNGFYHVAIAGLQAVRVRCTTTGTGTATVSMAATMSDSPADQTTLFRADSVQRVAIDPTALFTDTFETLDTTNMWTLGGTIPVVSGGQVSYPTGTAALASSWMRSIPTFPLQTTAFNQMAMVVQIEAATVTGNKAWWGMGIPQASPTVALPMLNGVVFEILDTDGQLYGAVYSNGARTASVLLNRPSDGAQHRYAINYKTSRVYFEIDNVTVGSIAQPNVQVSALALTAGTVNGAAVVGTARTLYTSLLGVADTGRNATQLSDGTYAWRKASIGRTGGLSVKGTAVVPVSATIAAAATGTVGPLDVSEAGNVTFVLKNSVAGSAWAGTPVVVFEQSDDNVSWAALSVTRSDTQSTGSTQSFTANSANVEIMCDAAAEGVNYVRARVTTGPTTNGMIVVIQAGGMPFSPAVSVLSPVRNNVTYYTAIPVLATATEALLNLTGTKGAATVAATTTPAVVTAGKTFRVTSISANYIATATSGYAIVRVRANTAGVVALTSPLYRAISVGAGTPATANSSGPTTAILPDSGLEFPPGSGVGITIQGYAAATATAVGYVFCELAGYEY